MQFHIRVIPIPDEPLLVTEDQVDAGQAWLETRVADGRLDLAVAFPETGGFMLVTVPSEDPAQAYAQLDALLADYPLLPTVHLEVNIALSTLKEGFDVLRRAVAEKRRIGS